MTPSPFTQDVLGRYICNTFEEARASADAAARPDARPFDTIVIGGGSFGAAVAQQLFHNDKTHKHRILVLDAGSFVLPEHVQNLPVLGLDVPGPTETDPGVLRNELWGLPWRTNVPDGFTGLAYCLGGRSLFFGGWSPRLLDEEMTETRWSAAVKTDLTEHYFDEAAEQIGTDTSNDFIHGKMHEAMRQQLAAGIRCNAVRGAIPLDELPLHLSEAEGAPAAVRELLRLEAPLAVQGRSSRSGFFPINKFSAIPLLIQVARAAQFRAVNDDVKKRLMVVPQCRVKQLVTADAGGGRKRVIGVDTLRGFVPVPEGGRVLLALGTIESTRLALLSFDGAPHFDRIGKNLVAHLRSNLTIRIPREAIATLEPCVKELQSSALFVKGRHTNADGTVRFFHLQITAAGLDKPSADSEAELFKKIPDVDTYQALRQTLDGHITITIRGIGEMEPQNAQSRVTLGDERDQDGVRRAFVTLLPSDNDNALWNTLDRCSDDVARVFAGDKEFEVLAHGQWVKANSAANLESLLPYKFRREGGRRDGLGTTHHEAGTLWMGDEAAGSVADADARLHGVTNAYVADPAAFPTLGSPNPMLTGMALTRRLADHLAPPPTPYVPEEPGFTALFNGFDTGKWRMSTIRRQPGRDNPGRFTLVDGALEAVPGNDLGLYWHTDPTPANFVLKLEWRRWTEDDNSGVFLRFPHPDSKNYDNTAYVGVHFGFEVQIDQRGEPDGLSQHRTGAIYNFAGPANPDALPVKPPGEWNLYEIRVENQTYTIRLNDQEITTFTFTGDPEFPDRGLPGTESAPRFLGLQTHPTGDPKRSRVAFRNIRIKAL